MISTMDFLVEPEHQDDKIVEQCYRCSPLKELLIVHVLLPNSCKKFLLDNQEDLNALFLKVGGAPKRYTIF